jgi:hypothetical protein
MTEHNTEESTTIESNGGIENKPNEFLQVLWQFGMYFKKIPENGVFSIPDFAKEFLEKVKQEARLTERKELKEKIGKMKIKPPKNADKYIDVFVGYMRYNKALSDVEKIL